MTAPTTSGGEPRQIIVLDFDGVICDGSLECALITWNAHFQLTIDDFGSSGLARIPAAFLKRFRESRGHARHLGHFLVPILAGQDHLPDQLAFDEFYDGLPAAVIANFVTNANRYRATARQDRHQEWLSYHRLYDGIVEVLTARPDRWYVVTAKDRESVLDILAANGLQLESNRIYGEQTDKSAALADVARRENARPHDVTFFDDSLPNVTKALRLGYDARWARWGFHTGEHSAQAERDGVDATDLADFAAVAAETAPVSTTKSRDSRC